jgi:adenylate kinase
LRAILLGAPGAGKGTQARRLADGFGVPQIATGDMFRAAVAAATQMGAAAKPFMDRGELVPDRITIGVVEERLGQPDAAAGFIMDGFPRTPEQATAFDALLAKMGRRLDAVIEISVPRDELIARLTKRLVCSKCQASYSAITAPPKVDGICDRCGGELVHRDDDAGGTVIKRLDLYLRKTAPLLDYYKGAGLLKTVDGTKSIDEVYAAIVAAAATDQRRAS